VRSGALRGLEFAAVGCNCSQAGGGKSLAVVRGEQLQHGYG
jgi:hypothetical protein